MNEKGYREREGSKGLVGTGKVEMIPIQRY